MMTSLPRRSHVAVCVVGALLALAIPSAAQRPPNIIFIYADDLGYGDLGSFGAKAIKMRMGEVIEQPVRQETLTLRYTQEAVGFIERSKGRPFFLYLPHNMPHIPLFASDKFKGRSAAGAYGDAVEELDWSVGEILSTLRRLGIDRDTLVIFTSDNGPWFQGSAGELRGRKGWTKNLTLNNPELFDMTVDAGESFNVSDRHPEIVKELQARIATALRTFPEEIQQANAQLMK